MLQSNPLCQGPHTRLGTPSAMRPPAAPSPAPALLSMLHAPSGHWAGTLHFTHHFLLLLQSHLQPHPRPPSAAPILILLASAPQLALGLLGAHCCPCALGTAHGHRTLSPGNRSFVTTCRPRTLSTNPWHDASSPLHCSLITNCHPCPLGSSSASLPPRSFSFPRGAPNCQPSQTPPACSALSPSQEKLCFSPRRWSLASHSRTWGAPYCTSCCSTEGCLAPGVPRSGRVNRQGLGGEGAAGAT